MRQLDLFDYSESKNRVIKTYAQAIPCIRRISKCYALQLDEDRRYITPGLGKDIFTDFNNLTNKEFLLKWERSLFGVSVISDLDFHDDGTYEGIGISMEVIYDVYTTDSGVLSIIFTDIAGVGYAFVEVSTKLSEELVKTFDRTLTLKGGFGSVRQFLESQFKYQ